MDNFGQISMRASDGASASPRPVVAVSAHLADVVRITEAARRLGIPLTALPVESALEACGRIRPALVVIDLTQAGATLLIQRLAEEGWPTVGFYPHVDEALRERAVLAGLGRAVPRSRFFGRLPDMLKPALDSGLP